jgi:hypothetical protein
LAAVKNIRNEMLRKHHADKASTEGAQPDDDIVRDIYKHYGVPEQGLKKKEAVAADEEEERQRKLSLHRARFCEKGDQCPPCVALCMSFAGCKTCCGETNSWHSCPAKKDWTLFLKAFPDELPRSSGFQILAHEGYGPFMEWKTRVKKVRESEEEVEKLEDKLKDRKKKEAEKKQAVQGAKAAVEDAVKTMIQNSPMRKELLKDRRFQGMMRLEDEDSDSVVTDSECTVCQEGSMKKSSKGYGCSNWKPNDPDNSCANFEPFNKTKRRRR